MPVIDWQPVHGVNRLTHQKQLRLAPAPQQPQTEKADEMIDEWRDGCPKSWNPCYGE